MVRIEEKIRDKLALKLSLLEENLILLNKEEYLRNKQGTRGFVDILAKDSQNRYVIIELKRSKSASREALHEILKYIEGIKKNKSLKDDEIIAYIVSTEWEELLIPFSSFVSQVAYTVIGYQLKIDKDLNPISANRVTPLKLENERLFSDVHDFSYYSTKDKLKQGIKSYQEVLKIKDIDEYVLIILKNDNYIHDFRLNGKKSVYNYIIYCAVQVQNNQKCLDIIYKNDKNYYQELIMP